MLAGKTFSRLLAVVAFLAYPLWCCLYIVGEMALFEVVVVVLAE